MLTIRAMSDGAGYAGRHLEHNDYYDEAKRVQGQWHGHGAEMLGLQGAVTSEQFEAVRQGLDPTTGEFLRQRHSADRTAADGTIGSKARTLYDFTVSAPKSVSIMAGPGGDSRLAEAHDRAFREMVKELESCACARVRRNGANHDRTTDNVVIAAYRHDTSRDLDPQLHTHAVAANMTYDGVEGRWKALQATPIFERHDYLTEVYRNALAREVMSLGYEVEARREQGKDCGFEIRGVSQDLRDKYSQRSEQRNRDIEEFTRKHGRAPTDNEVAVLVRESRSDKLVEISTEEVRAQQRARLTVEESRNLEELRQGSLERQVGGLRQDSEPSLQHAKEHVFERVSVCQDYELLTEALRHGRGRIGLGELRGVLRTEESRGDLLRVGTEVATKEGLERERRMVAQVNDGVGLHERLGRTHQFTVSDRLRPEQKAGVEFVLDSRDLAVNLRGAAGTGKTTALEELHRGLRESGREVCAVAPTMSAVEELQRVGFRNAVTVERLLQDGQMQAEAQDKVLIVDEAGMVSARQMAALMDIAEARSARIVFAGDTQQLQSVEAGDALRVLEKESQLKSMSLVQVQRQVVREYQEAVEELRIAPERGFARFEQMGAIREVPAEERARTVAEEYVRHQGKTNARGESASVLTVCWTHEEVRQVTEAIREHRREAGELGESVALSRHVSLNWTEAQKCDARNYQAGQVLEFHRPARGITKNEVLKVDRVEGNQVIARNARGEERTVTAKQAGCYSVHERRKVEVAANDRLLLTANRRERGFRATNGELVTVKSVDGEGRIELTDGRKLPANYRQFNHGYAVTAHRSQAKTVDFVVVSANTMPKEQFYVAATRGREGVAIVTSDRESLRESVGRSGARQSATELARKAERGKQPGLQQGAHRGMAAARQMACRAQQELAVPALAQAHQHEMVPEQYQIENRLEHRIEHRIEQEIGYDNGFEF